ncbi:energy transducer TonB [bacterium]|nr:energy transducer TonB [bacterium]
MRTKIYFYILSILIHIFILIFFVDFKLDINLDKKIKKTRSIVLKKNSFPKKEIAKEKKKDKEDKKEDDILKKDVVDISKPINEIKPDDPKYLAKYDSKVKKQTKVKKFTPSKNSVQISTNSQQTAIKKNITVQKQSAEEKIVENQKKMKEIKKKMDELGVKEILSKKESQEKQKTKNSVENSLNLPNSSKINPLSNQNNPLKFSDFEFSKMVRASNDYLKDVDEGDITSLDTLAYEHSDYFIKMKTQLSKEWNPAGVYQIHDPYRKIYGVKDRYTVLKVTINKDGNLDHISIRESSGLTFLDKEAIRAFEKAQPFKIVPSPLVAKTGSFTILFGFYVDNPDSPQIFYLKR